MQFSILWNGSALIFIKIVYVKKIPVISHYTLLEYCTEKEKKYKLNNKNQMKTKLHKQKCLHKAENKYLT